MMQSPVQQPPVPGTLATPRPMRLHPDVILHALSLASALIVFAMLIALVTVLVSGAMPAIRHFGVDFLTTSAWRTRPAAVRDPVAHQFARDSNGQLIRLPGQTFGALAVIYGTVVTSVVALVLAVPPSLSAAIFLSRVAPRLLAIPVSFLIEFLAAIPSLAYGLWGMYVLCPLLRDHVEPAIAAVLWHVPVMSRLVMNPDGTRMLLSGRDLLAGGLVLSIMILPIITAVSRDVLRAVPRAQVEGSVALGATWWQSCKEMLKYSRSGLLGAVTLGLARAAGETMAVTMVIGIHTQIDLSPFAPAQTMSSLLAVNFGEAGAGLEMSSLVEVALILLMMSLVLNLLARWLVVGKTARTPTGN